MLGVKKLSHMNSEISMRHKYVVTSLLIVKILNVKLKYLEKILRNIFKNANMNLLCVSFVRNILQDFS